MSLNVILQPKRRHFEEKGLKALKKETLGIKRLKEKKIWKKTFSRRDT